MGYFWINFIFHRINMCCDPRLEGSSHRVSLMYTKNLRELSSRLHVFSVKFCTSLRSLLCIADVGRIRHSSVIGQKYSVEPQWLEHLWDHEN